MMECAIVTRLELLSQDAWSFQAAHFLGHDDEVAQTEDDVTNINNCAHNLLKGAREGGGSPPG